MPYAVAATMDSFLSVSNSGNSSPLPRSSSSWMTAMMPSSTSKRFLVLCTMCALVGTHHYRYLNRQAQDEAERRTLSLMKNMNLDSALESIELHYRMNFPKDSRSMSIDLGHGQCRVTSAVPAEPTTELFSTLIAGYPGSGKRVTFMQVEAITGLITGDDYNLSGNHDHVAYMKSSYPHHEGIWSWQDKMSQIVMVIRNPRWALPSYATVLHEIDYAKTWQDAYERQGHVYSTRTPLQEWIAWRDARFDEEIHMWSWFIDFWMEGGMQRQYDGNHDLLYPELGPTYDHHCALEDIEDCRPVTIVAYERMTNPSTGPQELEKIVAVLQGKSGIDDHLLDSQEARQCIWTEVIMNHKGGKRVNVDRKGGPHREMYTFTSDQMDKIEGELVRLRNKYSAEEWSSNPTAQDLVSVLKDYIHDVRVEKQSGNNNNNVEYESVSPSTNIDAV